MEEALRAFLLAQAAVSDLVATRIYPVFLPQRPTLPAITYAKVSGPRDRDFDGPTGRATPRIQIDCWATTYAAAKELSEAVRGVLDGYQGLMDTVTVGSVKLENEIDFNEPDAEAETPVYRVLTDYIITHRE